METLCVILSENDWKKNLDKKDIKKVNHLILYLKKKMNGFFTFHAI